MQITPEIHLVYGVRGANSYLVKIAAEKLLVVDTGLPGNAGRIVRYIGGLGQSPADVSHIILTHADIDHAGSTAELKKATGARVVIHAGDAPVLAGRRRFKSVGGPLGVLFGLVLPLLRFHPVDPDIIVEDGFTLAGFRFIPTPGHTRGSLSLYRPGEVLFAGDAIYRRFALDPAQARATWQRIAGLQFEILLPGHGQPVVGAAAARLRARLAHPGPG